jgi:hypothetical protein
MQRLGALVEAELERLDSDRRALEDRDVARDIRRALRGFSRRLPHFELPPVPGAGAKGGSATGDASAGAGAAGSGWVGEATDGLPDPAGDDPVEPPSLFPAGPLHGVRIAPPQIEVAPGGEHRVRAVPADADGRRPADVTFEWSLDAHGDVLSLRGDGAKPALVASAEALPGLACVLRVVARQGGIRREAEAAVAVRESDAADSAAALGIPRPHFVSDAQGNWRSRMIGSRWEVNDAHEDFVALRGSARSRLRYLISLLAREIVVRSTTIEAAAPLDSMIDILAHAERNLRVT